MIDFTKQYFFEKVFFTLKKSSCWADSEEVESSIIIYKVICLRDIFLFLNFIIAMTNTPTREFWECLNTLDIILMIPLSIQKH